MIAFFAFNIYGFSQTFEKLYITESDDFSYDAIELDDSYIIQINSGDYFEQNFSLKYIKLNYEGEIIDSLNIAIPSEYEQYSTYKLFLLNDNVLLAVSPMKNNIGERCIRFTHISVNFDLLYDTIICDTNTTRHYFDFILNNDSNIVGVGYNVWFEEFFIFVYDIFGNTLGYNTYTDTQTGYLPSTVIDIPGRNVYHMFIYWSSNSYFFEINKETLEIDTVLQYPLSFLPRNAIKGIDDSSYFLAGKQGTTYLNAHWKLSF